MPLPPTPSNPGWTYNYTPSPLEWAATWSSKLDFYPTGLPIIYGGTGGTSVSEAIANLGISNVPFYCGVATGSPNAIAITPISPSVAPTEYATSQRYLFIAAGTNTGAVTVSVSSLPVKQIKVNGAACNDGDIITGCYYEIVYDGVYFEISAFSLGQFLQAGEGAVPRGAQEKARDFVSGFDFDMVGDAVWDGITVEGTNNAEFLRNAIASLDDGEPNEGKTLYIHAGNYKIATDESIVIPDRCGIVFDPRAQLFFDDLASSIFLFLNGVADTRGGYLYVRDPKITFCTPTGCGFDLLNASRCYFAGRMYGEGYIPPDWITNQPAVDATANVLLRIATSVSTDAFFNVFEHIDANHGKNGVVIGSGIASQQVIRYITGFGDALYGKTNAVMMAISSGQDSVVEVGYAESYTDDPVAGAICLLGPRVNRWHFDKIVFDHTNYAISGLPVPMTAFLIDDNGLGGYPKATRSLGCLFDPYCSITDNSPPENGNYIEGNPTTPGTPWTATLTCGTSGTITLTSGAIGNLCYYTRAGRNVRVWGCLAVASVSAPVGNLFIDNLPFAAANFGANRSACTIWANGLDVSCVTALQAFKGEQNKLIWITRFEAGSLVADVASKMKAGSILIFSCEYVAEEIQ